MKAFIKISSFMLALVMLASCFVGCGETPSDDEKESDTTADTVVDPGNTALSVKDWDGEVYTVLGRDGGSSSQFTNFEVGYDELPADVVGQAVYQRNDMIKEKYNFSVSQILSDDVASAAQTSYSSGDDLYQLVLYRADQVQAHAQQGYLVDLNDAELKYINLEHPAWYQEVNKELTIGDKLYYTTNNFLLQDKHRLWYCFYNRDLAEDLGLGYFEDMVDNNTWTLENVTQLAKQGYAELDGVAGASEGDRYGLAYSAHFTFAVFAFSAGFRLTSKDAQGYPTLVGATDKMMGILDSVFKLTDDPTVWCHIDHDYGDSAGHPEIKFKNGEVVLLQAFTSFIDFFLADDTGIEYGALPNPKYDSKQENYAVFPNVTNSCLLSIPYTVSNKEFAGYALEAITEESTDTSYTAYIDIKCKYQDAYDEDCARMLDLCFRSAVYDIGTFCDFGKLFSSLHSTNGLASLGHNFYQRYFDSAKTAAQKEIDEIRTEYESRT